MYNLDEFLTHEDNARALARQIAEEEPAASLRSIKLKIISNCNLRCEMCRYWRIAKQQLDRDTIIRVLDSAAALGSRKVHFSGGEVTLHRDLDDIIRHAAGLGMRVNLTSNGVIMDKERARRWIDAGLRSASFSLDSASPKMHDHIRGVPGAWKKTVRAVQILRREIDRKESRLKVRINTVLSRQNHRKLPELIRLAGSLGAIDVLPMPIDGKSVPRPTVEEIVRFNRDIVPECHTERRRYGMPLDAGRLFPFGRTQDEMRLAAEGHYGFGYYERCRCYAPWLHAFISHTGDVFGCCMTRERMPSLGNVKQESLAEIFQGAAYRRFRAEMLKSRLAICGNCDQYLRENRLVENRLQQLVLPAGEVLQDASNDAGFVRLESLNETAGKSLPNSLEVIS